MSHIDTVGNLHCSIPYYVVAGIEMIHKKESNESKLERAKNAMEIVVQTGRHILFETSELRLNAIHKETYIMNFLSILTGLYKLVPYVVAGIETIHANETTETKTQLAQDALSIATQAAVATLPSSDANVAQTVSAGVSAAIASTQAVIAAIKTPTTAATTAATN